MILKKLSARTYYRIGKNEALYGDDPLGPPERPEAYIAGYEDGCASPQTEKARRRIWANAVLVAENARLRRRSLACEEEAARLRGLVRDYRSLAKTQMWPSLAVLAGVLKRLESYSDR